MSISEAPGQAAPQAPEPSGFPASGAPVPAAPAAPASDGSGSSREAVRRAARLRALFATTALIGVLILLYPMYAPWFAKLNQREAVLDYSQAINAAEQQRREEQLAEADAYNATLSSGLIVDPFAGTGPGGAPELDEEARAYLAHLDLDPSGVMGVVTIPSLDVALPMYHGSTETVLRKGAGHIYGSSLPVGGPGTHAVIAGHSGIPGATLFNDLHLMEQGDTFKISTFGRQMYYRVTGTEVVEPTDISSLGVVPGRDLVTLLTCTPIGINSHRVLVHAERTDPPAAAWEDSAATRVAFPWWSLPVGAAVGLWGFVVWRTLRRPSSIAEGASTPTPNHPRSGT